MRLFFPLLALCAISTFSCKSKVKGDSTKEKKDVLAVNMDTTVSPGEDFSSMPMVVGLKIILFPANNHPGVSDTW